MKPRFPLIMILALAVFWAEGCSEIPENNDPVIGIWSRTDLSDGPAGKTTQREEWIFNDAYLGRYHFYENGTISIQTDFRWENNGSVYIIEYPGLDRIADQVTIKDSQDTEMLQDLKGEVLAQRE